MAVYGNFKGTTQPGFTVGKTGAASIYGNPSSPPASPTAGDVWMDSANTALKIYDGSEWSQGNFVGNLEGFIEIEVIAGENLVKGDVVYVSGSSGNTPQVSKALSNAGGAKMPAIGICEQTINSGNTGFIVVQGLLTGINTSAFAEGDVLYVSSTIAGAFTNTAPTGEENKIQNVGKVINSANGGSILVTGAGRFNATSALDSGNIFIGNGSNQAVTASLDTSVGDLGFLKNVVEDATPELGGDLDALGNNISGVDTLRINTDGAGLRMTSVGAFDNTGGNVAGNFRVFATNDLILNAGGNTGNAIVVDKTTLDTTFAGTITVHDAYTLPSADGTNGQYLQTNGSGAISFADGPIGYTGSQGDIGYTGSAGFNGSTGFNGSKGDQGVIGYTGSKGDIGFTGSTGFNGSTGFVGSQGATGANGTTGFTGSKGDTGFTGSAGNAVVAGAFVHTQSSAATTWTITHNLDSQYLNVEVIDSTGNSLVGTSNYPVVNFTSANVTTLTFSTSITGYAAITSGGGQQGSTGFTGSKGDTGFTGSASSVAGDTGFTGSQGDQGVIGFTGSKGDQGVTGFTGSTGSQGLIGFTGSQGDQGVVGFTGSQGIQGVVGFTGSQGDIGFTGSKGDTGFDGSVGFTGSQGGFGGATFEYDWSTNTTVSDPGAGTVKINNASLTAGTILSIDDTDAQGTDIQQFLRTIDDSTSAIKGHFRMANKLNADDFALYTISAISEETGYFEVTVAYVDGSATSFTDGEELIMTFARTGDKGDTGFAGSKGDTGFTGSVGFTGSKGDQGVIGFTGSQGDQGVIGYTGSAGSQGLIGFTGSKGDQGVIGYTGSKGDNGFTGSQGNNSVVGGFVFTQGSAATTWTVNHNLGQQFVNVEVVDSTGNSLVGTYDYPTIEFVTSNQLVATFSSATAGWLVASAGSGYTGSTGFNGSVGFTGSSGASLNLQQVTDNGDTTTTDVTLADVTSGNIVPLANNTYSLGTASNVWKDVHVGPGSVFVDGQEVLSADSSNVYVKSTTKDLVISAGSGKNIVFANPVVIQNDITGDISFNTLSDGSITVTQFQTTISDSDTIVPTSGAVVDYVTLQNSAQALGIAGDTGTSTVNLDTQTLSFAGSQGIVASVSGQTVTIELGDSGVSAGTYGSSTAIPVFVVDSQGRLTNASNASISTSFTLNGNTGSQIISNGDTFQLLGGTNITTVASSTDILTVNLDDDISLSNITSVDATITGEITATTVNATTLTDGTLSINGGDITSVSSITSADITSTGTLQFASLTDGTNTVSDILDEDNLVSDSATALATQQSIKAYVDSATGNNITFNVAGDTGSGTLVLATDTLTLAGTANEIETTYNNITDTFAIGIVGSPTLTGDVVITGNLTVNGTETIINSNTIASGDSIVVLNSDLPSGTAPSADGGWILNRGSSANVSLLWDEGDDYFIFANENSAQQEVRANVFHASYFNDGTAFLNSGSLSGAVNITATGIISFGTLTDGSVSVTNINTVVIDNDTSIATSGAIVDYVGSFNYLQNLNEDSTPQLGGELDLNSNDISGTGNIDISGSLITDLTDGEIYIGSSSNRTETVDLDTKITGLGYIKTAGSGTVTEVATAGSVNGITLTGGPITDSGTVTLGGALDDIRLDQLLDANVITSGESFVDTDTQLMTAAAIDDRVLSYGYSTTAGTVTEVATSGSVNGITLTGGPFTDSGTVTLGGTLENIALSQLLPANVITSGESFVDTDTQLMTAAAINDQIESFGYGTGTISQVTAGSGISGGGSSGTVELNVGAGDGITVNADNVAITATGVTATNYGSASQVGTFTVNALGQLTAASDVSIAIAATQITSGTIDSGRLPELTVADFAPAAIQLSSEGFTDSDTVLMTAAAIDDRINAYTPTDLTVADFADAAIQTSAEAFSDSDTVLMTAAAIDDRILSYGYTTNTGDITAVVAGDGLTGGSTSGSASLAVGAGTGVTVAADTVSIGQDVGTSASVTFGSVETTTLTTGSNATAGTVTGDWTLTAGSTWEATFADLAEKYTTDGPYEAGTVMKFGGDAELTQSDSINDHRVAGVISDAPAFTMNGGIDGQYLALTGRVPVKVVGTVRPGDLLVSSDTLGHAIVNNNAASGTIIGKAITSDANGVCEALVTLM